MFDKGGEGFFAGGKKALPSPCSFFSHTRREEQGRAAGNRPDRDKKAPPSARDGGDWNKGRTTSRPPSLFSYLAA